MQAYQDDGIPLSQKENEEFLTQAEEIKPSGTVIHPDDLKENEYYTVHALKGKYKKDGPQAILGQAFLVKAIQLPYLVGFLTADGTQPITLDVRDLDFMRVSKAFAAAQVRTVKRGPQD